MQTIDSSNIDYTKLPREKVYRNRCCLDDFDIKNQKSIERWMIACIYDSEIIELDDAEKYILEIFNAAHYIATVLLSQQKPIMNLAWCIKVAKGIGTDLEPVNESASKLFVAITLAMVTNYLKICDSKYRREGDMFVGRIELWINKNYDFHSEGLRLFRNAMKYIPEEVIIGSSDFMSRDDFKPLTSVSTEEASSDDNVTQRDDEEKCSRIQELEKEIQELKETIREYQARVKWMSQKKEKRAGIQLGLTPEQCIIFGNYITKKLKLSCSNKKDFAPMLNALFGWGTKSLSNKMSNTEDEEDEKYVAGIFAHYSHDIAKEIYIHWNETMLRDW